MTEKKRTGAPPGSNNGGGRKKSERELIRRNFLVYKDTPISSKQVREAIELFQKTNFRTNQTNGTRDRNREMMQVWLKLWEVVDKDDSNLIQSRSNNGGAYGYRTRRTYYAAQMPDGKWKVRVTTRHWSTSEFFEDDEGRCQQPSECCTYYIQNAEGNPTTTLWGVSYDEDGYPITSANAVLEQHSEETTLEAAIQDAGTDISSPYTWDGFMEYESETTVHTVTFSMAKARLTRLAEIGMPRPRN